MAKKNTKAINAWTEGENGTEKTNSVAIIKQSLLTLKQKGRFIVLMHKGYQSGSTVLMECSEKGLVIDRPVDWLGRQKKIRVVFKDEAQVWNYFATLVVEEGKDTLRAKFPIELFRIQRRSHFRIEMPAATCASFCTKEASYKNIKVKNLSVGGMMFCFPGKEMPEGLADQTEIKDICIDLNPSAQKTIDFSDLNNIPEDIIFISSGIIVRSFTNEDGGDCFLGAQFFLKIMEEEKLLKYVRSRELELLRKGLLD